MKSISYPKKSVKERVPSHKTLKELDLLKAAKENDFVQALSEQDLIESGKNSDNKTPQYPGGVALLNLQRRRLQDVSIVDLCERLEICDLSNNFIFDIRPLKWCINLFCLDLHSNQINRLPDKKFWSALKNLTVLYLHDNGVSRTEELKHLAHSPSLTYLSLYDSPISLKKTYRHCAVNAVFTLKALDSHVVSDEETIEDADFIERFKSLGKQFLFFPKYCTLKQKHSIPYDKTKKIVNNDLAKMNSIQSKFCPVIILQKHIRGFLVRLKYNYVQNTRLWAAVTIQRFFRYWKCYELPPQSPSDSLRYSVLSKSLSSLRLDYDTYLKMRRSKQKSIFSVKTETQSPVSLPLVFEVGEMDMDSLTQLKSMQSRVSGNLDRWGGNFPSRIYGTETSQLSYREAKNVYKTSIKPTTTSFNFQQMIKDVERIAKELGLSSIQEGQKSFMKIGKYHTQYAFLRQLEALKNKAVQENEDTDFRLKIRKPYVMQHDPLEEMILRTVEGADDIRKAVKEIDRQKHEMLLQRNKTRRSPPKHTNIRIERLFLKNQCNVEFSKFQSVERAYRDRDKAKVLLERSRHVNQMKEAERTARVRVKQFNHEYKNRACVKKHAAKANLQEELENKSAREAAFRRNTEYVRTSQAVSQEYARQNYKFALDFRSQLASVGKALAVHNIYKRKEDTRKKKRVIVLNTKDECQHKKLQLENSKQKKLAEQQDGWRTMKKDLEINLSKNAAMRELHARARVKHLQEQAVPQLRSTAVLRLRGLLP